VGGEVEEQLDHRQLVYRMTGSLLDGLPQAIPRSGMGTLIAVQGGRYLDICALEANEPMALWQMDVMGGVFGRWA
jgi:hypothetical protein